MQRLKRDLRTASLTGAVLSIIIFLWFYKHLTEHLILYPSRKFFTTGIAIIFVTTK